MIHESQGRIVDTEKVCLSSSVLVPYHNVGSCQESYDS